MTRYISQRDKYNCGPIAVMNALKWAGENITYDELEQFKVLCKCNRHTGGTEWAKLTTAVRKQQSIILSEVINKPSIKQIDNWLNKGNIVIVGYYWWKKPYDRKINQYATRKDGGWLGHFVMISEKFYGIYTMHNFGRYSTNFCTTKTLSKLLRNINSEINVSSRGYFIRKNGT